MKKLFSIVTVLAVCAIAQSQVLVDPYRFAAAGGGGGGGASFTDNFTRANANPMSTTASGGGTWTSGPGAYNDCQISGNTLGSTSGECAARVLTPSFAANQYAQCTFASSQNIGPMVRMQGTGNASGYLMHAGDSTHITIYKVVDTGTVSYTALGATYTVSTLTIGSVLKLTVTGTTLEPFVNGVSLGSTRTDSTYSTGQPGVYFGNVSLFISNFTAADL